MINYNISQYLCDDESKFIYSNRVKYSQTREWKYIRNIVDAMIRNRVEWKNFCHLLKDKETEGGLIIFGAGIWGNILYDETNSFINWKYVTDSDPKRKIEKLTSISFDEFIEKYENETVVISSYKNYFEMMQQLQNHEIPIGNIVNAGEVIYQITEYAIYFDLPYLVPNEHGEFFIDAGAFDGFTTKRFFQWCLGGGKSYSYCFEPDPKNMEKIKEVLLKQSNYQIVPKALWSATGTVSMDLKGSFASAINENNKQKVSQTIETITLDDFIGEREVTFIKMDIEGAEAAALYGAKKTIVSKHPRLAVSIYHKLEDIYEIPEIILSYYPHYRLYLRHYSFSSYDTVLYAVP